MLRTTVRRLRSRGLLLTARSLKSWTGRNSRLNSSVRLQSPATALVLLGFLPWLVSDQLPGALPPDSLLCARRMQISLGHAWEGSSTTPLRLRAMVSIKKGGFGTRCSTHQRPSFPPTARQPFCNSPWDSHGAAPVPHVVAARAQFRRTIHRRSMATRQHDA